MNKTISIIVPTHNRRDSLARLLDNLGNQTYPAGLIEVIVVADGCIDETIKMLGEYNSGYKLRYLEQAGLGAATARNNGAKAATGEIILFLDDDIEPSPGLIMAHIQAHINQNKVVVGYLPVSIPEKATFHQINLANWWEQKYRSMSDPTHRFGFNDLLSGNFSLSSLLFNKVDKFDCLFRCREDYELGVRLINSGAEFIFSEKAWGYHHDETNTLANSYIRKKAEGKADVQFSIKHPDLLIKLPLANYNSILSKYKHPLHFFVFKKLAVWDKIALLLIQLLTLLERLKQRSLWHRLNGKLHQFWYLRGIAEELNTPKKLKDFLQIFLSHRVQHNNDHDLEIDLQKGLTAAEKEIDEFRPRGLRIFYGEHFIGNVLPIAGVERIRSPHLRLLLVTQFPSTLMHALIMEQIVVSPLNNKMQEVP